VGGVYFPAGGAQMLPNTIEKAFERYGGQTLYEQMVDEILIQGGKACGVRLSDGVEIKAERVVANATVWNIYGKLVRPEHIPPERMKWVQALIPTYPSMTLYMIVEREGFPEGLFPWEIFIENRKVIDSSDLTLYVNSLVDSTLCPPDHLVVMAIAPNMCQWPHPDEPAYHSPEYEAQKQREADRMIDQIEGHYPGFRKQIRSLIIGSPTTIERYLLKNGGAVGGPKNQIGQEMLKRLHARSEWKNLYFCGDSTTMGTGAPATTVSGVGAANVILRELKMPDYDIRKFPKQFVNLVNLPYKRPSYSPTDPITRQNAFLAAAQCQGCQDPKCVDGCPAGIDIPGFMRRMEAKNYTGAARLIREKNPFGEICGLLCTPNRTCQKDCYRKEFATLPVRIAELQQWVCVEAGNEGWIKFNQQPSGPKVAIIGGGPSALTCSYYLSLAGCKVKLFAPELKPGGALLAGAVSDMLVKDALQREVETIISTGISFEGGKQIQGESDLNRILAEFKAVYLAESNLSACVVKYAAWFGDGWRNALDQQTGQIAAQPKVFVGQEFNMDGVSVVEAAASGRKAACSIDNYLRNQ